MTTLPRGHWYPANHAALTACLQAPPPGPRLAVFDWDNTCIFNDIGDATFRYQMDTLAVRLLPAVVDDLLPDRFGDADRDSENRLFAPWCAALRAIYRSLWPEVAAGQADTLRGSAAHQDWRAGICALYRAIEATPTLGANVAYPWLTRWFAGFTRDDIALLAQQAWNAALVEPIGTSTWLGPSHGYAFHFRTHVAPFREMMDLIRALHAAGFTVYIVTASHEAIVQGVVQHLGLPMAAEQIFGMRPDAPNYPTTYRAGKVEVIRRYLPGAPLLVAGDATTDYEMLTAFPETRIRLIIHRHSAERGPLGALHAAAIRGSNDTASVLTLLQGRDENTGEFVPTQTSRPAMS